MRAAPHTIGGTIRWMAFAAVFLTLPSALAQGEAEQTPRYGGTLVYAASSEPPNLNLALTSSSLTVSAASAVTEGLVSLVYEDGETKALPLLAESWEISDDGLEYTFHLRSGVMWHDGEPFTSADVKFTIEKISTQFHPYGQRIWGTILERIDTPDDVTVVFHLKEPFPILNILSVGDGSGGILPKHLYEGTDYINNPVNSEPVGTGPFVFESWARGDEIVFVRNLDYWDSTRPFLDRIVWRTVSDPTSLVNSLLSGEIDNVDWGAVPYSEIERIRQAPGISIIETPQRAAGMEFLQFNTRHPILGDKRVRQAIAYAIDTEFIKDVVFFGYSETASAHISSALGPAMWNSARPLDRYAFSPERANRLLDEAGYPRGAGGVRFKLTHAFPTHQPFQLTVGTVLAEQLAQVGIQVELRPMDISGFVATVYGEWDFDMMAHTLNTGPFPEIQTARLYVSDNIKKGVAFSNGTGYINPEVDVLFQQTSGTVDEEERARIFHRVQEILAEDLPTYPIWEVYYPIIVASSFHNVGTSPANSGGEMLWQEIWWDQAERAEP